jgi:HD-like signal output (HDOD) protein
VGVRSIPPEAFATALLHDVGKLVLARHLTPEVVAYLCECEGGNGLGFGIEVERAVLAIDHAALGGVVARSWGLPKSIAEGIEHHEQPLGARPDAGRYLALLVSCADAAAVQAGAMCGGLMNGPAFTHIHAEGLGIGRRAFDDLSLAVMKRLVVVMQRYE